MIAICVVLWFLQEKLDAFSVYYSNHYFWIGGEMHKEGIKKERDVWLNNFDFFFFTFEI